MNFYRYRGRLDHFMDDILSNKNFKKFVRQQRNLVKILSYGCNLDYSSMQKLTKGYLECETQSQSNTVEVCLDYYDVNSQHHPGEYITLSTVEESRFLQFEKELHKLPGHHVRCEYYVRGHYEVQLFGKEFSTMVQMPIDCSAIYREAVEGRYLYLIDTESEHNELIRHKMHRLPESLQTLSLPITVSAIQKEIYVKDWIRRIITY